MCGITGWVDFQRDLTAEQETLEAMTKTMTCRGPDASGIWIAPRAALGHRRLAVIDIEGGRQPMSVGAGGAHSSGDGVAAMTYSGEAYNYRELRAELAAAGHRFATESDTEVVLRAYLHWEDSFVERLNGMFALAIWDTRREELLLVRDRLGVKPLFYAPTRHGVLFGSEPKAILAHPDFEPVVDLDGFREMLAIVKTPERAVYNGMFEVRPGQVVTVSRSGLHKRRYWQLEAIPHTDDLQTTVATVRELLLDIVNRRFRRGPADPGHPVRPRPGRARRRRPQRHHPVDGRSDEPRHLPGRDQRLRPPGQLGRRGSRRCCCSSKPSGPTRRWRCRVSRPTRSLAATPGSSTLSR